MKVTFILSLLILGSCTILDKKIGLYSPKLSLSAEKNLITTKSGEKIQAKICNKMYFIIPTSNKNQFDAFEELLIKNSPYNALVEAKVKTTFFYFPLIYLQVCHEVSGNPILLEAN